MERNEIHRERKLLQDRLRVPPLQSDPSRAHNPTDERSGVGERPSVEGELLREVAHAVKDTRDESGERFGGQLGRDDLGLHSS